MADKSKTYLYERLLRLIEGEVYNQLDIKQVGGSQTLQLAAKSSSCFVPGKFDLVRGCGTVSLDAAIKAAHNRQILYCKSLNT